MVSERLTRLGIRRTSGAGAFPGVDRPQLAHPSRPRVARTPALVLAAGAVLLAAAPSAWAGAGLTTTADFPASLTVGQTGVPASVTVTNRSTAAEAAQSVILGTITLVASCATQAISGADCPAAALDPGVLRLPATAAGEASTACQGVTFALAVLDAAQGKYRLNPAAPVILGPPGSPTAACIIDLAVAVLRAPTRDADPGTAGRQTDQIAFALGVSSDGQSAGAFGTAQTTLAGARSPIGDTAGVPHADIRVRLQPRARRNAIAGEQDGVLRVSVGAAPVDGLANAALCKLLAKRAGIARGRVSVVRGERSREKVVRVEGLAAAELRRALGLPAP